MFTGIGIGMVSQRTATSLQALLFGQNEPGFTFEPWDITTLYQDRAGTTPVTDAGQSVGKRLDKSGRGNHQTAINDSARGIYGWMPKTGRRNLLTNTVFSGAIAGTPGTAPNTWVVDINTGTIAIPSAGVIEISAAAQRTVFRQTITVAAAQACTFSADVTVVSGVLTFQEAFDLSIVAGPTYTYFLDGVPATRTTTIPVGAHKLQVTVVNDATQRTFGGRFGIGVVSVQTGAMRITSPQFEFGSVKTAYQRVNSQYDITEAGVPTCYYVQPDGVDDAYVTPTITPNTDKVQVFAGVRKNSDAAAGMFIEHSATVATNGGVFDLQAPGTSPSSYKFENKGTTQVSASVTGIAAPVSNVITALGDISGDRATLRVNGSQAAQSTNDQGTGNYLAYPAYIYARSGTSLPFNGLDFGHAVRFGPNLDAATIARVESLIARNTPEVTL